MKKPVIKAKSSKSGKKQKQLKAITKASATKKVSSQKRLKNPTQKSKPSVEKIKPIATSTLQNIKVENQRLIRELQIEASLEKVRTRSMAMHQSSELADTASVLFNQIKELGFETWSCGFCIWTKNDMAEVWMAADSGGLLPPMMIPYKKEPTHAKIYEASLRGDITHDHIWEGKELVKHYTFLKTIPSVKKAIEILEKSGLTLPSRQCYYVGFFKHGYLLLITKEPNAELKNLSKRFASVFDITYTRFLDLQKAEAQAREAKIEAALERVRSRSMAMQKSIELVEVVHLLNDEIAGLAIKVDNTSILTDFSEPEKGSNNWIAVRGRHYLEKFHIPFNDTQLVSRRSMDARSKGLDYYTEKYNKVEKNRYFRWLYKYSDYKKIPEDRQQFTLKAPGWTRAISVSKNSNLIFQRFWLEEFTEEENSIFKRFGKVFEQSYTRFLDLQKAEAQSRESQIQLALERVRARTMAMQHSDELHQVNTIIIEQIKYFEPKIFSAGINIANPDEPVSEAWIGDPTEGQMPKVVYEHTKDPLAISMYKGWKEGKQIVVERLEGNALKKHFKHMVTLVPESIFKKLVPPELLVYHYAYFTNGFFVVVTREENPELPAILIRFAKVFEQTYTRFLDLQKAEAQAREAKIEAALERVRSSSMAMHQSSDLHNVIKVVTDQLCGLDLKFDVANFAKVDEHGNWDMWLSTPDQPYPALIFVPFFDHPIFNKVKEIIKNNITSYSDVYGFEEKNRFFKHFFENTDAKHAPETRKQHVLNRKGFARSLFLLKNIWFSVANYEGIPFKEDETSIFRRFAGVFEQSYTRFLDLQKAEAQTREAQIELGLERVRARAMAMQKSDELKELIGTVFIELTKLDLVLTRCLIMIYDPISNDSTWWMANSEAPTDPIGLWVPNHDQPPYKEYLKALQERKIKWQYTLEGKVKKDWDNFLFVETELSKLPDFVIAGMKAPERVYLNASFNSFGNLTLATLEPLSNEHFDILLRFAKVFDLTYTRFNDLQKAEAQAKEAKIEAALEKVRSRSLAMHKSEEIQHVVDEVSSRLKELGVGLDTANILIFKDTAEDVETWTASTPSSSYSTRFLLPVSSITHFSTMINAIKTGQELVTNKYDFNEKNKFFNYLFEQTDYRNIPEERKHFLLNSPCFTVSAAISKNIAIQLNSYSRDAFSDEENNILKRFTKVFEQAYTRFLDLQKAEAQTREAKIEAALERVRSSSMAMHQSSDLHNVINVVTDQLCGLDLKFDTASFAKVDEGGNWDVWLSTPDQPYPTLIFIPSFDHPIFNKVNEIIKNNIASFSDVYGFEEKNRFFKHFFENTDAKYAPETRKQHVLNRKGFARSLFLLKNIWFSVSNYDGIPFKDDETSIFRRFAGVFEQSYTRFLDLQKAEAQSREAQIELGLERVRARAMAMQNSEELNALIGTVFNELTKLDITLTRCVIMIYDPITNAARWWMANSEAPETPMNFLVQYHEHIPNLAYYNAWQQRTLKFQYTLEGEMKKDWDDFLFSKTELSSLPEFVIAGMRAPDRVYLNASFNNFGNLTLASLEPLSNEHFDILLRFAKVFDLTYTRFNDLQKAEAQTKEAKIEAALERVRSSSMAMHQSNDLRHVIQVVLGQIADLGIRHDAANFTKVNEDGSWEQWIANTDQNYPLQIHVPTFDHPITHFIKDIEKKGIDFMATVLSFEEKNRLMDHFFENTIAKNTPEERKKHIYERRGGAISTFSIKTLFLSIYNFDGIPYTNAENEIFKRFAIVFEQAYIRFLDLQKAEAQAREAQIEGALEKVRSKTMAMHNSQDVGNTVATMFEQLIQLGITTNRCGILIFSNTTDAEVWTAKSNPSGEATLIIGHLDVMMHPMLQGVRNAWKNKEPFFSYELIGEDIIDYYKSINNHPGYPTRFNLDHLPIKEIHSDFYFPEGAVFSFTSEPVTVEASMIFKRFAGVFGQTYRRYLDLQKAEMQARQAQIEVAMEKVRARALAMQKPDELIEVAQVLRKEMGSLGVEELETSSIYIHNETSGDTECWYAIKKIQDDEKKLVTDHMIINLQDTWVGRQMLEFYRSDKKQISIPMQGENRKEWIHYCSNHSKVLDGFYGENIPDRTYHLNKFSNGFIGAASPGDISPESWELLQRATAVFSLAYTRFSDLQYAEAQTREAIKRASVDRVRAEIASMRTTADLEKITPLVWNELTTLGVPFIRCGVFIMDEEKQEIHTFLSTPDGKAIAAFNTSFVTPGALTEAIPYWRRNEIFKTHWDEAQFLEQAQNLIQQGVITSPEKYLTEHRPTNLYLHFLPFLQGMLYVGSEISLNEDELQLVQNLANAFSTAYARYEDFNRLEEAKSKIETTLSDLKSTQSQLVQAEKMASLGELTAGIAHEIQNPLNFVNNFASINAELIDEMRQELAIGNEQYAIGNQQSAMQRLEAALQLANNIVDNELKIMHHGKRAESIVKGMLQHSRTSTGTKEPADINALADEYMRLSYHGLRAKDKSFNSEFKMDLDPTLPLVNVIPQDIGRVLLNLFNNAFWAVNEKLKSKGDFKSPLDLAGYLPTVTLITKNLGNKIEIRIADNGPGIPSHIIDKIFQPFFTTKPTGQGTGLGLSLAYDIVNAHGGSISVRSNYYEPGILEAKKHDPLVAEWNKELEGNEGLPNGQAGTEFTITLPVKVY